MNIRRAAVAAGSEDKSDRFFMGLLGLEKLGSRGLTADLALLLFDQDRPLPVIEYGNADLTFVVYLTDGLTHPAPHLNHVSLEVDDREDLAARAQSMGLPVRRAVKGDLHLIFIKDLDGNQYELLPPA